jgi:hypothetical protein
MRARSVWLAGITAVGVLLGGCANEDGPATLPIVTSYPVDRAGNSTVEVVPSSSPGDVESEVRALYARFAQLSNSSYTSREALEQRRALYADSCVSCSAGHEIARNVLDNGYGFQGEPVIVKSVEMESIDGNTVTFRAVVDSPAASIVDRQGTIINKFEAFDGLTTLYAAERRASGQWIIVSDRVLGIGK